MPTTSSPFADSTTDTLWGKKDGRQIFECATTGAIFFDRRSIVHEDYQEYYPYLKTFDSRRFAWELGVRRSKYRRQLRVMSGHVTGRRLLDVGAGPGYLVKVAIEEGWDAKGVEISAEAVRHGQREFRVEYVELAQVPDESLDAITCHHVLEHIEEAAAFLALLRSKLKTRGLLVLHVPHQRPLTFAMRDIAQRVWLRDRAERFCCLYGDVHINGFTPSSLKNVLLANGFGVYFVRSTGMWSKYFDPFFTRNYVEARKWGALTRKALRHVIETLGRPFGLGDWVIGYFFKAG